MDFQICGLLCFVLVYCYYYYYYYYYYYLLVCLLVSPCGHTLVLIAVFPPDLFHFCFNVIKMILEVSVKFCKK